MENIELLENEIWKDIKGFEEYYQISNLGRVKNIKKNKLLKQSVDKYGYLKVSLSKLNKPYFFTIHRLVLPAFVENINNLPEINHIDGIKTNNKLENLEWISHTDNLKHAFKLGMRNQNGENNHRATLTKENIIEIRQLYSEGNVTHQELSRIYKVSRRHIGNIIQNKLWKHIK